MATKTMIELVDDIDGSTADETIRFALDASTFEIDLSAANAAKFRDALQPYVSAGRRQRGRRRSS